MRTIRLFLFAAAAVSASISQAAITDISFQTVDNSAGGAALDGYVTQDIYVTGTGQLTSIELLLDGGAAGSIYQDGVGNNLAPNAAFFPTFPSLEFDTFVGLGGKVSGMGFTPSVAGGAVDIGGAAASTFTNAKIDMTWFPAGGDAINDPTDYFVGRVTLKNDVSGAFNIAAFTGTESFIQMDVPIANGVMNPITGAALNAIEDDISAALQGAFDTRDGGPIMLASAITVENTMGALGDLGTISALVTFNTGEGDTFATGTASDGDGDGVYDLEISADWASLPRNQLLSGVVDFTSESGDPNMDSVTFSIGVPEPSTVALSCLALVGLVGFARRK